MISPMASYERCSAGSRNGADWQHGVCSSQMGRLASRPPSSSTRRPPARAAVGVGGLLGGLAFRTTPAAVTSTAPVLFAATTGNNDVNPSGNITF